MLRVGILGATGIVGQKFIDVLRNHPWFEVTELMASERSAGKAYGDVVSWQPTGDIPHGLADKVVRPCDPDRLNLDFVLSGLDASVAEPIEIAFASSGIPVISNTRVHRMVPDVPLIIPEINPHHLDLISHQRTRLKSHGFIVTNPNCSTIVLALALAPIHEKFDVRKVFLSTMQAVSGAGYPGVSSMDIIDNVLPFIPGEEEKIESEPLKIFGRLDTGSIEYSNMVISSRCHRVNVRDGHLMSVSIALENPPDLQELKLAWQEYSPEILQLNLPTAPARPVRITARPDRPQPIRDRDAGDGMTVTIGRVKPCPILDFSFSALGHNTVRGAAGGSVLIAELLKSRGYFQN